MEHTLLVCRYVERQAFANESYVGQDDIFALVDHGSFVFDNGGGEQTVSQLEGVNFRQGVRYERYITSPAGIFYSVFRPTATCSAAGK